MIPVYRCQQGRIQVQTSACERVIPQLQFNRVGRDARERTMLRCLQFGSCANAVYTGATVDLDVAIKEIQTNS